MFDFDVNVAYRVQALNAMSGATMLLAIIQLLKFSSVCLIWLTLKGTMMIMKQGSECCRAAHYWCWQPLDNLVSLFLLRTPDDHHPSLEDQWSSIFIPNVWESAKFTSPCPLFILTIVNCPTQPTCIAHCDLCICQLYFITNPEWKYERNTAGQLVSGVSNPYSLFFRTKSQIGEPCPPPFPPNHPPREQDLYDKI